LPFRNHPETRRLSRYRPQSTAGCGSACTELREYLEEHGQAYALRVPCSFWLALAPPPGRVGQLPPTDPGMIPLTIPCTPETAQLISSASWRTSATPGLVLALSSVSR
jgi:hypothetical protein